MHQNIFQKTINTKEVLITRRDEEFVFLAADGSIIRCFLCVCIPKSATWCATTFLQLKLATPNSLSTQSTVKVSDHRPPHASRTSLLLHMTEQACPAISTMSASSNVALEAPRKTKFATRSQHLPSPNRPLRPRKRMRAADVDLPLTTHCNSHLYSHLSRSHPRGMPSSCTKVRIEPEFCITTVDCLQTRSGVGNPTNQSLNKPTSHALRPRTLHHASCFQLAPPESVLLSFLQNQSSTMRAFSTEVFRYPRRHRVFQCARKPMQAAGSGPRFPREHSH